MPDKIIYPASYLLKDLLPAELIMGLDDAIDFLAVDPDFINVQWTSEGLATRYRFYILQELSFRLPFLSDISIHIGEPDSFPYFDLSFQSSPMAKFSIDNLILSIKANANILQAYEKDGEVWQPKAGVVGYELAWNTGLSVDITGKFNFKSPELSGVPPFMIGDSGFIIDFTESASSDSAADIRWINDDIPPELSEKIPPGFKGMFISRAAMYYSKLDSGTRLPRIGIANANIGSGGFSGSAIVGDEREDPAISEERLKEEDFDVSELTGDHIAGFELGGLEIILWHLKVSFMQSIPDGFLLTGLVFLPFANKWIKFKASAGGPEADFMLEIGGTADAPLISIEHELFEIKADSIAYKLQDDIHYAIITGSIKPKIEGFDWPEMKVDGLSISSEGDISIPGGWLKAPNEITLDFKAFKIGISEIGFGNEGEEEATKKQWLGFSGSINLVEGLELGASVEGLKFSWLKNGTGPVDVSMKGIAVEFEIPNTLSFEGSVKYETLTEENNGGTGLTGDLFKGNIKLNLMAVRLEIEAELMIGKLKDAEGHEFTTFFIVLGAELPTGLPLGATGTSLYGIKGLAAIHAGPTKTNEQNWYEWYLSNPERNITSIQKWKPIYDEYGFGAGVTIGTMYDDGFTLNMSVMLVVLIPGPVIILEGKANILKQRSADKKEEGAFYLLAVLDGRAGTFMINIDVRYSLEDVITVGANLEAFFDFNNSSNWYLHIGKKEPEAKRIRAEILSLFKASAYFMIDSKSLLFGASVGLDIRKTFGPVSFSLIAKISLDAGIFWKPLQMEGRLELYAEIALKIFGIGIELYLQMLLEGKVPEPYWIHGLAKVGIKLFWPLPDLELEVEFTWEQPGEVQPVMPFLKECSFIHHKDNGATWAMELLTDDLRATDLSNLSIIPIDARPVLTFARPVHNLKRHASGGVALPVLSLLSDEVGGKSLEYKMDQLELQEWTVTGWNSIRTGINTGADDEFTIDQDNIRNLEEGTEPNEPQIELWRYHAADMADRYQREDFNDRHPPCNHITTQQWIRVDWRGQADTLYDYQFEYAGLHFVCDEVAGEQAPNVSRSELLHTPEFLIQFPELVYQVAVYLTQESADIAGYVLKDGAKIGDMTKTGPVLFYRGFDPIEGIRTEGRTLIITSIVYMTQKSVIDQLARTNDNHPNVTEQNINGPLVLSPATYYRLKVATSVDVDSVLRTDTVTTNYAYFRTDEGPGISALQDGHGTNEESKELAYKKKPVQQFASYIEKTLPIDGAKNFYSGYDMGIQFNEAYVAKMFSNPINMVIKDRNGKTLEAPEGSFREGFLPLMPFGLLTWLQGKVAGECSTIIPSTPAPYLNFITSLPFKLNSLYTAEVMTQGSNGDQLLHNFQFTTSMYANITEHFLSKYPDGRIKTIDLPKVAISRVEDTRPLVLALKAYRLALNDFRGTSGDLINVYTIIEQVKYKYNRLNEESITLFDSLDKIVNKSLRKINMEKRSRAPKFEIFKIPINNDTDNLILLESPEPIDWLRITASLIHEGIILKTSIISNDDKTRAFLMHSRSLLFKSGEYTVKMNFSGEADPITGIILQNGLIVNEGIRFQMNV